MFVSSPIEKDKHFKDMALDFLGLFIYTKIEHMFY